MCGIFAYCSFLQEKVGIVSRVVRVGSMRANTMRSKGTYDAAVKSKLQRGGKVPACVFVMAMIP